jgi:hypothetical protein
VKHLLTDRKWVLRTPIITTFLLEIANVQQLWQMWVIDHSADGQSLTGWLSVQAALWLWLNFYRVITPEARFAIWGTRVGIALNMTVCLSVLYWRYACVLLN